MIAHSAAPKTEEYTPTTTDIRDGFAFNYSRDYEDFSDGYYEALRFGEAAFSRWLAEYTRQQREEAWDCARSEVRSLPSWYSSETGKGGFDLQPLGPDESSEEGAWNAVMSILDDNPYRAEP